MKDDKSTNKSTRKISYAFVAHAVYICVLIFGVLFLAYDLNKIKSSVNELGADFAKGLRVVLAPSEEFEAGFQDIVVSKLNEIATMDPGEMDAAETFLKVKSCIAQGDIATAKLYCINAINHAPGNIKYYQTYNEMISAEAGSSVEAGDLEQFKNILTTGIYQVRGQDVEVMLNLLSQIDARQASIEEAEAAQGIAERKLMFSEAMAEVRNGRLSRNSIFQNKHYDECLLLLEERHSMFKKLLEEEFASQDERQWILEETKRNEIAATYCKHVSLIQAFLDRAENLLKADDNNLGAASVAIQSASQYLSEALGLEAAFLPERSTEEIKGFVARIEKLERDFNYIKSMPALKKIAAFEKPASFKTQEEAIIEATSRITQISQQLPLVYDSDIRNEKEAYLKELVQIISDCKEKQYKMYQEWAISQCDMAFKKYRSWKRVDEIDAVSVIRDYLIEIDPIQLNPDVHRLYQDVLGKQLDELGKVTRVNIEMELARTKKKTLKDF